MKGIQDLKIMCLGRYHVAFLTFRFLHWTFTVQRLVSKVILNVVLFFILMNIVFFFFFFLKENIKSLSFPELPKIKQLILKVGAWDDDSLLQFTSLVKACPNLRRFVMQVLVLFSFMISYI